MTALVYSTDDPRRTRIGLIVLRTDEVLEDELRRILPFDRVSLHVTRIPSAPTVTGETLARMEADLPAAARLLPDTEFDSIGYGCTSGATIIGPARVASLIADACTTRHTTDPLTATIAACRTLTLRRIAFVTPYVADVSQAMRERLQDAGIDIVAFGSFEEVRDDRVARIDQASIRAAIRDIGTGPSDAVFLSCTNLRALDTVQPLETDLAKPIITSNTALAWHLCRQSGLRAQSGLGQLLATTGPPDVS